MARKKAVLIFKPPAKKGSGLVVVVNTSKKERIALGFTPRVSLKSGMIVEPNFGSLSLGMRKRNPKKPIYAVAKGKASLSVVILSHEEHKRGFSPVKRQSFALND